MRASHARSRTGGVLLLVLASCVLWPQVAAAKPAVKIAKLGKPRGGQFNDWFNSVSLSADEHWLAASDISGVIQIWQLDTS